MDTPRASMHMPPARALCLASAVALLWFLYWIGYGFVVWNARAFLVNCWGAILSVWLILGVSRLTTVKNMLDIPKKKENEELANVLDELIELRHQYEELIASLKARL